MIHEIKKHELLPMPNPIGISWDDLYLRVIQCVNEEAHNQTGAERLYKCEIININFYTREEIDSLTAQKNCLINFINH